MRFAAAGPLEYEHRPVAESLALAIPGKSLQIQMDLGLIEALGAEVMGGFWAVPKRGAEVGGILFGAVVEQRTLLLQDLEPVASEHRRGPSYLLSSSDRQRLGQAVARARAAGRNVVGYYRSHIRKRLELDEEDAVLFAALCPDPSSVFLLLEPSPSAAIKASFFLREDGELRRDAPVLQVPLGAKHSTGARTVQLPAPEAAPRLVAVPRPPAPAAGSRTLWIAIALAAVALMAFIAYRGAGLPRGAGVQADNSPALRVEPSGGYLRLNWNRNAPAVLSARQASLWITDGAVHKELKLNSEGLRAGSVTYGPLTDDVDFRLELRTSDAGVVTESVRAVNVLPPGAPAGLAAPSGSGKPTVSSRRSTPKERKVARRRWVWDY